jgi:hypothetical protein
MLALTIFLQGATMYFNNLIKTKTLVRLRVDMGYKIIAYIIDVSQTKTSLLARLLIVHLQLSKPKSAGEMSKVSKFFFSRYY